MKELSIEEKAKAYDEAIERARCYKGLEAEMSNVFPELKESEDDKIRKKLIQYFSTFTLETFAGLSPKKIIAWLEKQGEKKAIWHNEDEEPQRGSLILLIMQSGNPIVAKIIEPNHTFNHGERWAYIDDLLEKQGEQKPADKVEPKFKVGDWIIQENIGVYKVIEICKSWYEVIDAEDNHYSISFDKEYMCHLWTIQDAKPGDIIYLPNCNNEYYFFIFKGIENEAVMSFADFYQYNDGTFEVDGAISNLSSVNDVFQLATKEQRNTLIKAMADAGYTFDFEKKELKKIDQKSAWSKEDEKEVAVLEAYIRSKDWSYSHIDRALGIVDKLVNKVKSLRPQTTWKPSDEQIEILEMVLTNESMDDNIAIILRELREQLKKLKG